MLAARRAVRGQQLEQLESGRRPGWGAVLLTCLALTWLNPHVYLDTVLLVGSIAATHGAAGRWWFGAGACLASVVWFSALGLGARLLVPVFHRRSAWRVLDGAVAVLMWTLAVSLLLR